MGWLAGWSTFIVCFLCRHFHLLYVEVHRYKVQFNVSLGRALLKLDASLKLCLQASLTLLVEMHKLSVLQHHILTNYLPVRDQLQRERERERERERGRERDLHHCECVSEVGLPRTKCCNVIVFPALR